MRGLLKNCFISYNCEIDEEELVIATPSRINETAGPSSSPLKRISVPNRKRHTYISRTKRKKKEKIKNLKIQNKKWLKETYTQLFYPYLQAKNC